MFCDILKSVLDEFDVRVTYLYGKIEDSHGSNICAEVDYTIVTDGDTITDIEDMSLSIYHLDKNAEHDIVSHEVGHIISSKTAIGKNINTLKVDSDGYVAITNLRNFFGNNYTRAMRNEMRKCSLQWNKIFNQKTRGNIPKMYLSDEQEQCADFVSIALLYPDMISRIAPNSYRAFVKNATNGEYGSTMQRLFLSERNT